MNAQDKKIENQQMPRKADALESAEAPLKLTELKTADMTNCKKYEMLGSRRYFFREKSRTRVLDANLLV
jgi:hypothetical protein